MNPRLFAVIVATAVLAPGLAAAQGTPDCDKIIQVLEKRGAPTAGVTLDMAQQWQKNGHNIACKTVLPRVEAAASGAAAPAATPAAAQPAAAPAAAPDRPKRWWER